MDLNDTIAHFKANYPVLSDEDIESVLGIAKIIPTTRGELLIRFGECKKDIIFVLKGIVLAYYIKENGQEMTPFFWSEDLITASWESIYANEASKLNFEVIDPGIVITVDFIEFKKMVNESDTLRRTYIDMMETILTNTLIHVQSIPK